MSGSQVLRSHIPGSSSGGYSSILVSLAKAVWNEDNESSLVDREWFAMAGSIGCISTVRDVGREGDEDDEGGSVSG